MVENRKKHLLLADDLEDDFTFAATTTTTTTTKTPKIKREKWSLEEDGGKEYKNEPAGWFWKNVLEPR